MNDQTMEAIEMKLMKIQFKGVKKCMTCTFHNLSASDQTLSSDSSYQHKLNQSCLPGDKTEST